MYLLKRLFKIRLWSIVFVLLAIIIPIIACRPIEDETAVSLLDAQLQQLIIDQNLVPLSGNDTNDTLNINAINSAQVELGRLLFFDKLLSGNKDISCATCHHPTQDTGDRLAVSIGTGGNGLGPERILGYGRRLIPRNAPEIFNRGETTWHTMFWDSRVALNEDGTFRSPAGAQLPDGLNNVLAVQAMFPVTARDEMRGAIGDVDYYGQPNELALIADDDLPAIWEALMKRILAIPEYADRFATAYPETPGDQLGFQHAANAIAAFEAETFSFPNSPWTGCLTGDMDDVPEAAKRGALLFFGEAQCSTCHSGPLLTDQAHHNIAVPQIGPGKGDMAPLDLGLALTTGKAGDRYAFRTPSLHNVALTAPYMHNGAYRTLEAVVRHHLSPTESFYHYDPSQHLSPALQDTWQNDKRILLDVISGLDYQVVPKRVFTDAEVADIVAFLKILTDPAAAQLDQLEIMPDTVPSGLPVVDTF